MDALVVGCPHGLRPAFGRGPAGFVGVEGKVVRKKKTEQ